MDLKPLVEGALGLGMRLDASQTAAFTDFGRSLYERNAVVNLTRVLEDQCAVRHFLDSLLVSPLIPASAKVLDIGTGPGFPAWPLACARPDLKVTALDSWRKGLAFLMTHPLPNLEILEGRAESVVRREAFDVVTGRAFAPFAVQAEASAAWVKVGGLFVPFRTPAESDLVLTFGGDVLGLRLRDKITASLPHGAGDRLFPVFEKVTRTDRGYPRSWAEMKKRPIGT